MIKSIKTIISEEWLIDGGMAFGVVPKSIWSKLYPISNDNLIPVVNRLLLVETESKLILFNTGYGNKRNEKYYKYKHFGMKTSIETLLNQCGYKKSDLTDIVFTHLHDDHCGGATFTDTNDGLSKPVFENVNYYVSEDQWKWALYPNPREAASYFPDNLLPLHNTGKLNLLTEQMQVFEEDGIYLKFFNGHTKGQILPFLNFNEKTLVYLSDFIPSTVHLPLPYISAADIFPLTVMEEKEQFLISALNGNYVLIFEHDFINEACNLAKNEKGITVNYAGSLDDVLKNQN